MRKETNEIEIQEIIDEAVKRAEWYETDYYAQLVQAFRYKLCMSSVEIVHNVRSSCA